MKRVITAVFLVPAVAFIVLYTSSFWLLVAATAVILLALAEYNNLNLTKGGPVATKAASMAFAAALAWTLYYCGTAAAGAVILLASFSFFLLNMARGRGLPVEVEAGEGAPASDPGLFRDAAGDVLARTFGLVYVALPFSFLPLVRDFNRGGWWIMTLFFIIWGNDTFAYYTGRMLGRHRLSPRISPKKTVEGAFGGIVGGVIAAFICRALFGLDVDAPFLAAFAVVAGAVGITGDLAESVLKRAAGVKDSGNLIPGHGGVLDRTDSLLFAFPLLYYFLLWHLKA